ncbi:MAG: fumarylacetoacetate hydrolase family protein [Rhodospirillales bacterium]
MRLCSYRQAGRDRYGVMTDGGIVDLTDRIGDKHPTLVRLLEDDALKAAGEASAGQKPDFGLDDVEYLPVTLEPVTIFCLGLNYAEHAAEGGQEPPSFPRGFVKVRQSLVGHNQPIVRPSISDKFDFEVEYTIVIGKPARHVPEDKAMEYVAGYTIMNDGSLRDYQKERATDHGKNFWRTSGMGPCMVTRDAAPAWKDTVVETRLNGSVMQRDTVDHLVLGVPFLVSYFSRFTLLRPGDMIATGSPAGVGHRRKPPLFLKPGDMLEMEITGIGVLRTPVIDEAEALER